MPPKFDPNAIHIGKQSPSELDGKSGVVDKAPIRWLIGRPHGFSAIEFITII